MAGFQCGDYALAHDLRWLDALRPLAAVAGVILHASRILEVLARLGVGQTAQRDNNLYENLNQLQYDHGMPRPLSRCLHQLRQLGNDARHVVRPLNVADAEFAFYAVIHWLGWYFRDFRHGPRRLCNSMT